MVILNDDDDDYRVSWCRCPGRPVRWRTKPLWKGSENVRSDQINEDRRWSWVRCNIYHISMKQNCLRRTSTFLACWTNRFVTCHFIFSLLSFLFLFILVGERGLLHVIHLFRCFFYFYYTGSTGLLFPSPWKARNESEKVKVFPNFSRQEKLFCCQTSRAESYLVAPLYLDIRYYF